MNNGLNDNKNFYQQSSANQRKLLSEGSEKLNFQLYDNIYEKLLPEQDEMKRARFEAFDDMTTSTTLNELEMQSEETILYGIESLLSGTTTTTIPTTNQPTL